MAKNKFVTAYKSLALVFFNTVVLLVLINTALFFLFKVWDRYCRNVNPIQRKYKQFKSQLYPQLSEAQVNDMLLESWTQKPIFEPFTGFRERPHRGRYVNVDDNGYRRCPDQGAWPPNKEGINVFFFGGSTTFGYGNEDRDTIPCYFQDAARKATGKPVHVYNFGRSNYYSSQERILFEKLLVQNRVPDVAIFVDGLNDFGHDLVNGEDTPSFSDTLSNLMNPDPWKGAQTLTKRIADNLPLTRFLFSFTHGAIRFLIRPPKLSAATTTASYDESRTRLVVDRYIRNKKMIEALAKEHRVVSIHIWQPVPYYKTLPDANPFSVLVPDFYGSSGKRYEYMEKLSSQPDFPKKNFLWCADIQQDLPGPLYVDGYHYAAPLARLLAQKIAAFSINRGLARTSVKT